MTNGATRLIALRVDESAGGTLADGRSTAPARWVTLVWSGPTKGQFVLESSTDLMTWQPEPLELLSEAEGRFTGRCRASGNQLQFYRLRLLP